MLDWGQYEIPERTKKSLTKYIEQGQATDDFLRCVLCNDLVGAATRTDQEHRDSIHHIAFWLWNLAPEACWGNEAKYLRWLQDHPKNSKNKIGPHEV